MKCIQNVTPGRSHPDGSRFLFSNILGFFLKPEDAIFGDVGVSQRRAIIVELVHDLTCSVKTELLTWILN